jgi:hypothetical protein
MNDVVLDNPPKIVIPEGRMAAPGDYRIMPVRLNVAGRPQNIDLIQQTFQGNCAEYTTLNTVLIARAAGFAVNPAVAEYLAHNPRFNLDAVERDLVIPLTLNAQETHMREVPTTQVDVDNLVIKADSPRESLTKSNSVLLFRESLSPVTMKFNGSDQIRNQADIQRMRSNEVAAIFMGSSDHATSLLKLGEQYIHVDPFFNQNIAKVIPEQDALGILARVISQPGSIATINPLCAK